MLNYVWLGLLIAGIGTALVTDIINQNQNKFGNNKTLNVSIIIPDNFSPNSGDKIDCKIKISTETYKNVFGDKVETDIFLGGKLTVDYNKKNLPVVLTVEASSPALIREMAGASGDKNNLFGTVTSFTFDSSGIYSTTMILEEINFVRLKKITESVLEYASIAVNIALGLIGIMALWLGVMKVAEQAGLITIIAKIVKPLTKRLFPDVPSDHPAMGSMIMNISANMLGLGNAATPFGLKAMEELNKLNPDKGVASNSMITFLAINTAGITMIPATAIAIRAAAGSSDPAIIIGTSLFASCCATVAGVSAAKIFEKFSDPKTGSSSPGSSLMKILSITGIFIFAVFLLLYFGGSKLSLLVSSILNPEKIKDIIQTVSILAIPLLIISFICYGAVKKVRVYEQFVEGAKEGFNIAVRIIPYLVAMLMAIGIFRAGGAMEWLIYILEPVTGFIGMPAEALTMALMRPLSGSGSLGIMTEIISVHGADSFMGILVSTFYGSTETTFYVLAVYFGAVNIKKTRHALPAGLVADVVGILAALFIVKYLF